MGINIGYLLIQLTCLAIIVGIGLAVVVIVVRRLDSGAGGEYIMSVEVTPEGALIPRQLLAQDVERVEIRKKHGRFLIVPVSPKKQNGATAVTDT